MWPCRDTMRHISHFGDSPLEGLAPVSGGYHCALLYPRLASMPGLEIIHRCLLPTLLGWGPSNTVHTVVFVRWRCFCDPLGVVNCSFREKVNVSHGTKSPERGEIHSSSGVLKLKDGLSSCCFRMNEQNMRGNVAQYVYPAALLARRTRYTFDRKSPVWVFTFNYRLCLSLKKDEVSVSLDLFGFCRKCFRLGKGMMSGYLPGYVTVKTNMIKQWVRRRRRWRVIYTKKCL